MFAEQALIYLHSRELLHIRAAKPRELTAKNYQFRVTLAAEITIAKYKVLYLGELVLFIN